MGHIVFISTPQVKVSLKNVGTIYVDDYVVSVLMGKSHIWMRQLELKILGDEKLGNIMI